MAEYGLLPEGLRIPTLDELVAEVVDELRPKWGESFDFSDADSTYQQIVTHQKGLLEVWQALEALAAGMTREGSSGITLAANLAITGTEWPEATYSTVPLILTGIPLTVVPNKSVASAASTGARFVTDDDATLVAVDPLQFSHAYDVDERVYSTGGVYQVVDDGTTAASGAITDTTTSIITHGTVGFRWLGKGTAAADVAASAEVPGPVVAASSDIVKIATPVGGWQSVINLEEATVGRNAATDGEARLAGEADVYRPGATTPDAVRQSLFDISGVTVVDIIRNVTDVTDPDGVPPHAVEAIVTGGDDQEIADVLRRECIAAGIPTYGNTTLTSYDAEGNPQSVSFTRVTDVPIYVAATVEKIATIAANQATFPADGEAQAKAAIVGWGNALTGGRNIVARAVASQIFERLDPVTGIQIGGVTGVLDVPVCNIGTSPSPSSSATIVLTRRQRGAFATDRIALTLTDGSV